MKLLKLTAAALILVAGSASAQTIVGSAHDLSGETYTTEICNVCHTPHNANASYDPLWNHEVSGATFGVYANAATLDATVGQPAGTSLLCLSCHDGTVAMDNFGGTDDGTDILTGSALVGTDLSNDHPISFTYDAALVTADGELKATSENSGLGGTIAEDLLFGDSMECASCHDVHNAYGGDFLLVKPNAASALCLTCHDK